MRREVWGLTNDVNSFGGKCYCCDINIDYDDFDCGHV